MQGTKNAFVFAGQVVQLKELKRKDGSIWGHSVLVGSAVGQAACEFIVPERDWMRLKGGDMIEIQGHLEQRGYNCEPRVDALGPISSQESKKSA